MCLKAGGVNKLAMQRERLYCLGHQTFHDQVALQHNLRHIIYFTNRISESLTNFRK